MRLGSSYREGGERKKCLGSEKRHGGMKCACALECKLSEAKQGLAFEEKHVTVKCEGNFRNISEAKCRGHVK